MPVYDLSADPADPVLDEAAVLALVRRHVPAAQAVTAVDESGGEARAYAVDGDIIVKIQRPHKVRPRTSLAKEACFLQQLAAADKGLPVPRVLGYGHAEPRLEYLCLTRIPGVALRSVQASAAARQAALGALGATLHRIHQTPQAPLRASGLFPGDQRAADLHARLAESFAGPVQRLQADHEAWPLAVPPADVAARALAALPLTDERVALHANPGPDHMFVDPATGHFQGLIDFGDAYVSHPALDLWCWGRPDDRAAVLAGYTAAAPVSAVFLAVWRVVTVLTDMRVLVAYPERRDTTAADLQSVLATL